MASITFQPLSANLQTTDIGSPILFSIENDSSTSYSIYWIDRSGVPQLYEQLGPKGTYNQQTVSSHAWKVVGSDGSGFEFYPSSQGKIIINADQTERFIDASEQIIQTPHGLWSTDTGYGLINVAKSLGITDLGSNLPIGGKNNNIALDAISASSAWAAGYTGKGVTVAVLDVGIGANPEVSKNIIGGYDFAQNDMDPSPDNGNYRDHPLGVASIIAASHDPHSGADTMGVAPDASLLNVRVGTSNGSASNNIAAGIHYAVDNGAKVICMPLESSSPALDQQVADAVHYAFQHNVVTVIIGGNYSNYGPTGPALTAAVANEAIDVGNFNALSGSLYASSNKAGLTPFNWVVANSSGYTPTVDGSYAFHDDGGTSFAGPYVAGLAALLFQQNPNATATEIMNKITSGASMGSQPGNVITGTSAIDTHVFSGASANYTITTSSDGFLITDNSTQLSTDLVSIERLTFSDKSIALDVGNGNGGEVYRLYQAAFNRAPDKAGLGFWMNSMDHGKSLADVASGFMASDEFKKLYGTNPSNTDLVNAMYHNVLHRDADADGLKFWLGAMDHGVSAGQLLTSFSDSAENIANAVKIIGQGFEYTPFHG